MSIIAETLVEWFRGVRQRFFFAAVRVTVEEAAADLEAESIGVKKRRYEQLHEALDFASQLPVAQDKYKQRALDLFREDLLDIRGVTDGVLSGRIPYAEAGEALRDLPPGSGSSETSLPDKSKPVVRQALPDGSGPRDPETPDPPHEPKATPPVKRGRGRPPKPRPLPRPQPNGSGQGESPTPGQP